MEAKHMSKAAESGKFSEINNAMAAIIKTRDERIMDRFAFTINVDLAPRRFANGVMMRMVKMENNANRCAMRSGAHMNLHRFSNLSYRNIMAVNRAACK